MVCMLQFSLSHHTELCVNSRHPSFLRFCVGNSGQEPKSRLGVFWPFTSCTIYTFHSPAFLGLRLWPFP